MLHRPTIQQIKQTATVQIQRNRCPKYPPWAFTHALRQRLHRRIATAIMFVVQRCSHLNQPTHSTRIYVYIRYFCVRYTFSNSQQDSSPVGSEVWTSVPCHCALRTTAWLTLCVTSHQVGLHVRGGMYMYVINCTIMFRTTWTNFCMVHGTAW